MNWNTGALPASFNGGFIATADLKDQRILPLIPVVHTVPLLEITQETSKPNKTIRYY